MTPPQHVIDHAITVAKLSPCRSKRGVALWATDTGNLVGQGGFNSPPDRCCPGRSICAGSCGRRSVHAEVRAISSAAAHRFGRLNASATVDMLHVEISPGAKVVGCDGPRCPGCSALISDVGFVAGVWLFECDRGWSGWRRYAAREFYAVTMQNLSI